MSIQTKEFLETDLIAGLQQGSEEAYHYLVDRYSAMLFGVIGRIVHEKEDAENILQDAFVKIWMNIERYDASKGRLATWMLNVARNTAIDFTRSKLYAQRSKNHNIENNVGFETDSLKTHIAVDSIGLKQVVEALPVQFREIIEWMYFEGFTQQEISENFGIPLGTVKTRTRMALTALRKSFVE
jgi:RNA polymerase sigma-70 factor, ECF subfamily